MAEKNLVLPVKTMEQSIDEALGLIQTERSGAINGLYTRWKGINNFMMKYWRFSSVTTIAGMSGSGKSSILNMIEDDFTNPILNPTFLRHQDANGNWVGEDKIIVLAFKYEMDAADEVLRTLSGKVQKSYSYLLSSKLVKRNQNISETDVYNRVTDEEFETYNVELKKLIDRPIVYIETAGNLEQFYATCAYYKQKYPSRRLVVTLDHSLLSKKLSEKDDMELTAHTAQIAIQIRKVFGALVIFLSQLNGEIEKPLRRENPALHFPVKTDIHCGNQLYWACDNVLIFHRPELLNIRRYGLVKTATESFAIDTTDVIHAACIKSRKNSIGSIWFKNQFEIGNMLQVSPNSIKYVKPENAIE